MPGEIRRIRVDRDRCIAAGLCVAAAPRTFTIDEDNKAAVINAQGDDEDAIWEAAEGCPTTAIFLYDSDGRQIYP